MSNSLSLREESRTIYPEYKGGKARKESQNRYNASGSIRARDPERRDEKAGGTSQPRRHVPI